MVALVKVVVPWEVVALGGGGGGAGLGGGGGAMGGGGFGGGGGAMGGGGTIHETTEEAIVDDANKGNDA